MNWSEEELVELATFLSRRMDTRLERRDPTDLPPPGDPVGDWVAELKAANAAGRLPKLATRVRAVDPSDTNLQEVCGLLAQRDPAPLRKVVAGSLVFALTLVAIGGAAAGWMGNEAATPSVVLQPQSLTAVAPEPTRFDEPTPVAEVLPEPTPALAAEPVEAPPTPVEAATVAVAPPVPGCEAPKGELIGYWYAGEDAPGAAGEAVTIAQTVNVRADYPDVHNEFNKRADVRCILDEGAQVVLTQSPIRVPGDHYWVPLVGGDLVPKTPRGAVSRATTAAPAKPTGA